MKNTDEDGYPTDNPYVSKRWCLFKRKFTDRTILQVEKAKSEEE